MKKTPLLIIPLLLSFTGIPGKQENWIVRDVKVTYMGCAYLRDNANIRTYVSDGYGEPQANGSHLFIANPRSNKYTFYYMGNTVGQGVFRPLEPGQEIEIYLSRYVAQKDKDKIAEVIFTAKFVKAD